MSTQPEDFEDENPPVSTDYSGLIQVNVTDITNDHPIELATVEIYDEKTPPELLYTLRTDSSGQTEQVSLPSPPFDYSQSPNQPVPYTDYTIKISAYGYQPMTVTGSSIFPENTSFQPVRMTPLEDLPGKDLIIIGPNTLNGDFPPKEWEAEIKPIGEGEIVLSRVVVPETIVVHDGLPTNSSAPNYYVPYRDYIKNVASSEIYSTWPEATLIANILAIQSFTLNRVYTEWYRNQGYEFTITSSTQFDHKWVYGRNIFQEISIIVDEIFDQYLSFPEVKQPILTQYCDGKRVTCSGWMSQWGSQSLGEEGYSPIEILRYYYGDTMYINIAEQISGIPASWPRYDLTIGAEGDKVRQLQEQLLVISEIYSAIPSVTPTGYYDEVTADAVRAFQKVFGLPQSGVTDFSTWYKISQIYVGLTRIAELR